MTAPEGVEADRWVFGYGSLMWRPGFTYVERRPARLIGLRRALCVYSHVHRGTPELPGLVLGLDRGGSCVGVAFRVAAADWSETIAYLRDREQATSVYVETIRTVTLDDGRRAPALLYAVDRAHRQYAGALPPERLLALVRRGVGVSGANPDYVIATHRHLTTLGVRDATLAWLAERLEEGGVEADDPSAHPMEGEARG